MITEKADYFDWHIEYIPCDGARISVLRFAGQDLLTSSPAAFAPPEKFFGEFETRPVYGYDDCFPTVDACEYPGNGFRCRDHGEICWQEWNTIESGNSLAFAVECQRPAVTFRRLMTFGPDALTWKFEVISHEPQRIDFLHVMHALLPLKEITEIEFPGCKTIFDEGNSEETGMRSAAELGEQLLAFQPGSFGMYLLQEISRGFFRLRLRSGYTLEVLFDRKLFPTLGVWWNNKGYPESGILRTECAFEPIPGTCSDLSKSFRDGVYLSVDAYGKISWDIEWVVSKVSPFEGG